MSATYYALTKHHIPAFGVETSKFLPSIDLKVRHHNLVINSFMGMFGIFPESPRLILDPPKLKYLVVSINGQIPIVLDEEAVLELQSGDSIYVTHIEANYERGLSLDILGYGGLNDYRKDFVIFRDTTLLVRKDNEKFAEIPVKICEHRPKQVRKTPASNKVDYFIIEAKGHRLLLADGGTLHLTLGDEMKIVDVIPSPANSSGITVNFKGFVGNKIHNTGEDRGYTVRTDRDLMRRYSLKDRGEFYEIIVSKDDHVLGRAVVKLDPPKMDYMILRVNSHKHLYLRPEESATLSPEDVITLMNVQTNLYDYKDVHLHVNGQRIRPGESKKIRDLFSSSKATRHEAAIQKGPLVLGSIFLNIN
jgi:hypothetical protein